MDDYAFCETVHAGSRSRWHIRRLTKTGCKLGGGADTPALCGIAVSWDLSVAISADHLAHACPQCVAAYRGEVK